LSQDPIGYEAGDTNYYRYVGNGSLYGIDPYGLADPYRVGVGLGLLVVGGALSAADLGAASGWFIGAGAGILFYEFFLNNKVSAASISCIPTKPTKAYTSSYETSTTSYITNTSYINSYSTQPYEYSPLKESTNSYYEYEISLDDYSADYSENWLGIDDVA